MFSRYLLLNLANAVRKRRCAPTRLTVSKTKNSKLFHSRKSCGTRLALLCLCILQYLTDVIHSPWLIITCLSLPNLLSIPFVLTLQTISPTTALAIYSLRIFQDYGVRFSANG